MSPLLRAFRSTLTLLCFVPLMAPGQTEHFNFKRYLTGEPSTLSVGIVSLDTATGVVQFNGVDTQGPTTPFAWAWGDGSVSDGFFPQSHTYTDRQRNYVVTVVSTYAGGGHDTAGVVVWFAAPAVAPVALSPDIAVHVPASPLTLGTRLYTPPSTLAAFDDSFFPVLPRSTLEYVLSVAATIQKEFANSDTYLFQGAFEQYMLRDSSFGGAYSLWFTDPVTFGVGDVFIRGAIDYSSLFHEMGHNFTLNTPSSHYYGGKIDGNANAIYSETMAQIFQHATGYDIVNAYETFGLGEELMTDIKQQVIRTVGFLRGSYDSYVASGAPYSSWNSPSTPADDTFGTFMTLAFTFCVHAEEGGAGYRVPLQRMMHLLQGFDSDWAQRYDALNNTAAADTFRSTLMVSALSYAFSSDLRAEFRDLHFPIDDHLYMELYNSPTEVPARETAYPAYVELIGCYPNPFNPVTAVRYRLPSAGDVRVAVHDLLGREVAVLVDEKRPAGCFDVRFDASSLPSGVYLLRLTAGRINQTVKAVLIR